MNQQIKRNDILRPAWTGRGARSYYVLEANGEMLTVKRFNVTTQMCYGSAIVTTYAAIQAAWAKNQQRQGVDSAPRWESRWQPRAQVQHNDWNHAPEPEGANRH